jgi:hypothetical protein
MASLGKVVTLLLLASGCRMAKAEPRWVEAHGAAELHAIAASPRGVEGLGHGDSVLHYPGIYAAPWARPWSGKASSIAATLESTYVLTAGGDVLRLAQGESKLWRSATGPALSSIASGLSNELMGIAEGKAYRLTRSAANVVACTAPVRQVVALDDEAFVLAEDGSVAREHDERCEPVPLPSKATAFFFLSDGRVYQKRGERVMRLPDPEVYRETGHHKTQVTSISASERTLWAVSNEGFVFQLVEP